MPKVCPRCAHALIPRTFGAEHLDGCAICGGLWFDRDELNRITRDPNVGLMEVERAFNRTLEADISHGDMNCPNCAIPLTPFAFPHTPDIPMHFCQQCRGIWLDEGEMQAIAERIAAARAQAPTPPPTLSEQQRQQTRHAVGFLLSTPCPYCQTANPAASHVCRMCGKPLQPQEALRLCPRCDGPLTEIAEAGMRLDACARCSGVWLEEGCLSAFLQLERDTFTRIRQRVAALHKPPHLAHCPSCHHEMQPHAFDSAGLVQTTRCIHCGSEWLDAGDLVTAYELVQREGFLCLHAGEIDIWNRD